MIRLADEFFETKNDPSQLSITEEVMNQLRSIHPATMGEKAIDNGPIAWTIVIPTTHEICADFVNGMIGEEELMQRTLAQKVYTSLYLCSALVLPEFRGNGLAKELVMDSLRSIRTHHAITELFVWSFSIEGSGLAKSIAASAGLPLIERLDVKRH